MRGLKGRIQGQYDPLVRKALSKVGGGGVMLRSGGGSGFPILMSGYNYAGELQLADATTKLQVLGVIDGQNTAAAYEAGEIWGLGILDANPGKVYYAIATGAVATLPVATLQEMGAANTCCATIANPSVMNCSLALSATALAAGACSTVGPALGNAAFLPWGGAYVGF